MAQQRIRFFGNRDDGYIAKRGTVQVEVVRVTGGWQGCFTGSPSAHNRWWRTDRCERVRSCTCPTFTVTEVFKTRKAAAEKALDLKAQDERLTWEGRFSEARATLEGVATAVEDQPSNVRECLGFGADQPRSA